MSERALEYLKFYFGDISACSGTTVKYDLWNHIRISQPIYIYIHFNDLGHFYTWKFVWKVRCNFSVHLTKLRTDKKWGCQSEWLVFLQEFSTCLPSMWLMSFHAKKCNTMRVTSSPMPIFYDYSMHNIVLENIPHTCCGQLWVWHIVCGQTCDGLYHFAFYLVSFGIPLGSHTIKPALARHTGVQVSLVPAKVITWSFLANQYWHLSYPTYGCAWVVLWLLFFRSAPSTFPDTWSTFKGPFRGVPSR